MRTVPNVLVTGTPGTGKSSMVRELISQVPALRAIDIGAMVRDRQPHNGWDEEYQSYILDEDKVSSAVWPTQRRRSLTR